MKTSSLFLRLIVIIGPGLLGLGQDDLSIENEQSNVNLAVNFTSGDLTMKFPFYMETVRTIDQRLKERITDDWIETLGQVNKMVQKELSTKKGSLRFIRLAGMAKDFVLLVHKHDAKRDKMKISSPVGRKFTIDMRRFFLRVLERAQESEKAYAKTKPGGTKETLTKFNNFVQAFGEAIRLSPVADFWNWTESTINGQPLADYMGDIVGELRHHAFGGVINLVQMFLKL